MKSGEWTVSSNEEEGYAETAPTREQAIAEYVYGYAPEVGETIFVGQVKQPTIPALDVQGAIENACADAEWPECVGERFLPNMRPNSPAMKDLQSRIDATVAEWVTANNVFGGSFIVDGIESYTVTQADVDTSLAREAARAATNP